MPAAIKAPPFFCQAFINDENDDEGWSEGFWLQKATYADALSELLAFLALRMGTLTPEFIAVYARVSSADIRGDTEAAYPGGIGAHGTYKWGSSPVGDSLPSDECAYIRAEGSVTPVGPPRPNIPVHTIRPIHGIPRNALDPAHDRQLNVFAGSSQYYDALNNLLKAWIARGTWYEVSKPATIGTPTPWQVTKASVNIFTGRRKVGRPFDASRGRVVAR